MGLTSFASTQCFGGSSGAFKALVGAAAIVILGASAAHADEAWTIRSAPAARLAQASGLPPGEIPGAQEEQSGDPAAATVVRLDRLENQLRAANGAIEELQNQQRRLEEQLKKFEEDLEFRLNGAKGAAPIAEAPAPAKPIRRSDAFDPGADPNAAGAPRPLGTTPPSAPLTPAPGAVSAPLDLSHNSANPPLPAGPLASAEGPNVIPGIEGPPDDPREQFKVALETYRSGQFDQAEQQFRALLAKNARSPFAPDAIFYLGETYLKRSRTREAAEQYLRLSTDYAKSPLAPSAMLRLGQSLAALDNNAQACATFGEIGRRYPTATAALKKSVESEMQKDHC